MGLVVGTKYFSPDWTFWVYSKALYIYYYSCPKIRVLFPGAMPLAILMSPRWGFSISPFGKCY